MSDTVIRVSLEPIELVADRPNEVAVCLTNVGRGTCTCIVLRLSLPMHLILLEGRGRIEVPRLEAGETVKRAVRLMPKVVGDWTLASSNFSYVDAQGQSQRITDMRMGITVVPIPPELLIPEPEFRVRLSTTEVPLKEWAILKGQMINTGRTALKQFALRVFGPVTCDPNILKQTFGPLGPGEAADFEISLRANESGDKVPVHIEATYTDIANRTGRRRALTPLRVLAATSKPDFPPAVGVKVDTMITILFLAADPINTGSLRIGEELREIQERLQLAKMRDRFDLQSRMAVRPTDLGQALLDTSPQVVHFSGHGTNSGAICLEDKLGNSHPVEADALASLFELVADQVDCVILNACYSAAQAEGIARSIKYVIGMNQRISDKAAVVFAIGFYQAFGAGKSIEEAYRFGCVQIRLQGIPEHLTPVLISRND